MRTHLIGGLMVATLAMSMPLDADARPFRPGLLPNGTENSCSNCHVSAGGGGVRTAFGEDVRANVSIGGQEFFWTDVCDLDSDNDGLTNGQELGDPCCLWDDTNDDVLRLGDISLPGDETSMSADPNGPDDDGDGISNLCDPDYVPPDPDMGMGGDDMGTGDPDMGGSGDMGAPPANNTTGNNTTGNNTPGNNTPGNNGSPDMGTGGGDMGGTSLDDDGGCGCASAPTSTATPWLLALALVFGRLRRRI